MNEPVLALAFPLGGREPVDPGFGAHPRPPHIDNGHPWHPGSGHIDNTLPVPPAPPTTKPPIQVWPPTAPIFHPGIDNELPPPGAIWPPLPPGMPEGELLVLVYITGIGWRWTVIDTSLAVDNTLPPAAAPKA